MNRTIPWAIPLLLLLLCAPSFSQTVTINHKVQRYVGAVSQLDRSRFFNFHSNASDADATAFQNQYNVGKGRQFYTPFAVAYGQNNNTAGIYPALQGGNPAVKSTNRVVATDHPYKVFKNGINATAAANWAADYYKNASGAIPEFFEPMNEPFVHAGDFYSGGFNAAQEASMRLQMSQLYNAIAAKIRDTPALANMKMVGYSSAYPELERNDFGHWNTNQKLFMDEAGANMDCFSTHLYDGINVTGQDTRRSGSNSEAILDLIETYSYAKWGVVKPHAITEYGAIETGYGPGYSDIASVQSVRSINHMLFNLLDREDKMAISIPFITDKSTWHINAANNYQPYGAALWKPSNIGQPNPTGWVFTPRINFYELWKDVKGRRVLANSNNPDIQIQAFVDGNKLFVAINNLDDASNTINLNFASALAGFQNVRIKSLKIYDQAAPVLSDNVQTTAPASLTLIAGETAILEYTFASNVTFDNVIRGKKYYTSKHLQNISANTPISFTFNNVTTGSGFAKLRMGIGRKHNRSKAPIVKVNGTTVAVPGNWKGYDQANRTDFFGAIEIPVPANLVQANNTVTVEFPDTGGKLSSLVLEMQKYDTAPAGQGPYAGNVGAIPGTIESENYDTGGQGVAYNDTDTGNSGGQYRTSEGVDITTASEGGHAVGWTVAGEWLEYTVNVASAGDYRADIRYAAGTSTTGQIYLAFDGTNQSGTVDLAPTGGWQTWATVSKNVTLSAGQQVMRVFVQTAGINLNKITFASIAPVNETVTVNSPPTSIVSNTSLTFSINYQAVSARDVVVEFWSSTSWLGQTRQPVTAGTGNISVTVNLPSAPPAGTGYIIKSSIRPTGGDWTTAINTDNVNNITVTASSGQTPFGGTARTVPGRVEAEDYDEGGQGVAYSDTNTANDGGQYRTDGVDIQTTGDTDGNYNVGWTNTSEWMEYTINFSTTQDYDFFPRVASPASTAKFRILIDGVDKTGELAVPNTGGYQTYQTMHIRNINVTAGIHVVRLEIIAGGFNLNYWAAWASPPPAARVARVCL
ncbi:carbohydrate-binding protein [Fulvivirga sp. M361]|uniref:carbohydrate-binding protein n=1 Tax=Fulvivirga sp. M361 TaxID=2594266 RepID=UPI00117B5FF1|nr:carbohydrate-binding protein [Fulvivirga sp. M361]TRX48004.1 carbohydrate-binding protein [Fulvivirga sp. M361]